MLVPRNRTYIMPFIGWVQRVAHAREDVCESLGPASPSAVVQYGACEDPTPSQSAWCTAVACRARGSQRSQKTVHATQVHERHLLNAST
jgi:hypothetical protein